MLGSWRTRVKSTHLADGTKFKIKNKETSVFWTQNEFVWGSLWIGTCVHKNDKKNSKAVFFKQFKCLCCHRMVIFESLKKAKKKEQVRCISESRLCHGSTKSLFYSLTWSCYDNSDKKRHFNCFKREGLGDFVCAIV